MGAWVEGVPVQLLTCLVGWDSGDAESSKPHALPRNPVKSP